jgi:hypothetical protein
MIKNKYLLTHTPGPWTVGFVTVADSGDGRAGLLVADETTSLGFRFIASIEFAEQKLAGRRADEMPDFRLMSVAPELLALALQYRDDLRYPPSSDSTERRLAAIEAVIAKIVAEK